MPAQSQQQQKLFGLALAFKRGEVPASEVSDEIKDIADRMSDFASTKHKGLPKMKEQLRKIVREIMREKVISEMESINEAKIYKVIFTGVQEKDAKDFFTMIDRSPKIKAMTKDSGVFKVGNEVTIRFGVGSKQELELIKKVAKLEGLKIVKIDESVTEGKKVFTVNPGIGKVKYSISSHDGVKKHKDGSDFYDIKTFKNKVDLEKAIKDYTSKGFKMESVNEGIEPQIKKIAYFTGTRPEAVEDFVSKHALNFTKLLKYVEKGGLPQRMELVSAIAGRPNNPKQKKIIKMFNESVNEGYSTEEKRIVMMAVRKLAKYRNVPLDYAINDLLGAGQELERDIKKGKIK
jgi:hypothetical protein